MIIRPYLRGIHRQSSLLVRIVVNVDATVRRIAKIWLRTATRGAVIQNVIVAVVVTLAVGQVGPGTLLKVGNMEINLGQVLNKSNIFECRYISKRKLKQNQNN